MKYFKLSMLFMLLSMLMHSSGFSQVKVVDFSWFDSLRKSESDTTYVVNFWATWCVPCVAELPEFERIRSKYKEKKVKVILVSLDYVKVLEKTVIPLVKKKGLQSEIVLLNESNPNSYIDKVDPAWSGSLPATLIFNNNNAFYQFFEKPLNFAELNSILLKSRSK